MEFNNVYNVRLKKQYNGVILPKIDAWTLIHHRVNFIPNKWSAIMKPFQSAINLLLRDLGEKNHLIKFLSVFIQSIIISFWIGSVYLWCMEPCLRAIISNYYFDKFCRILSSLSNWCRFTLWKQFLQILFHLISNNVKFGLNSSSGFLKI